MEVQEAYDQQCVAKETTLRSKEHRRKDGTKRTKSPRPTAPQHRSTKETVISRGNKIPTFKTSTHQVLAVRSESAVLYDSAVGVECPGVEGGNGNSFVTSSSPSISLYTDIVELIEGRIDAILNLACTSS